ncbi:DUF6541 family protein [Corynebacterium sp. H127]|uniref:DUF6541 family protein n=1 Tax=Corynebacterium sp. H127 TaxID=3133418 RepID=UPI0030AA9569
MGMVSAAAVAVAVFTIPGLVVSWLSGVRGQWSIAAALPTTFGIYGLAAWFFGLTPIRFEVVSVGIFSAVLVVLALLWRLAFVAFGRRRRKQSEVSAPLDGDGDAVAVEKPKRDWRRGTLLDEYWLIPGLGMLAGVALIGGRSLELLNKAARKMDNIIQGWDVHWHASTVRYIVETGIASPTRMGDLQNTETQAKMYYPTAWHAGAGLVADLANISPIAATNLTGLLVPAIGFPISVGLIAWRLVGRRGLTAQIAAGLAPIIVGGIPVLYWIGLYVGAWPYVAAVSVSGIVLALFMSVPYFPIRSFVAALAFIGMVQLHPSAATIVVLGLALWWLLYLVWVPARKPGSFKGHVGWRFRDLALLGATGLVGVIALLPQILIGAEQSEEVKSFTATENLSLTEAWRAAIFMNTRHAPTFELNVVPWIWLALFGAVALLVWRRNLWAPTFWFLSVCCTVNSLRPFGDPWGKWLGAVGALHYNTGHRLIMPAALFVVAGAAVALAVLIRLIALAPLKKFAVVSAVVSILLAGGAGFVIQKVVRTGIEPGSAWAINAARDDRLVNGRDVKAFDWLAQQPHAYEGAIFTNPDEGSGWMYAYNRLPAVFKHYLWPNTTLESATNRLFWHPMRLGQGNFDNMDEANMVDTAAQELGVNFIYISPPHFWHFQIPRPDFETGLIHTPGVTPVYKDHEVIIYAVNAEFSDEEILKMRAPGNSPEELPSLVTKEEAGKATSYEDANEPYIHRPTVPNRGRDSHFEWLTQRNELSDMADEGVKTGDSVAAELQDQQQH